MIRFRTASGEIVSPGGDPNVKKGMVPTPPLKGNVGFSTTPPLSPLSDPRDARIAELQAKVARLEAKLAAANTANSVTPVSTETANTKTDRKSYQRDLMRDRRAAKKLGITVAAYRALKP